MATKFSIKDETSAADRLTVDESRQFNFGAAAPSKPLSIDGQTFKDTDGKLGDTRVPGEGLDRVTGTGTLPSGVSNPSFTITHNLGRTALALIETRVGSMNIFISDHTTTSFTVKPSTDPAGASLGSAINVDYSYL